ncbi:MAG: cache domain-containing protein, partial [Clostridiales Family XIII bacterium]|nr:cache domain-containing protein [Clostridiales Family XIII bacterium]
MLKDRNSHGDGMSMRMKAIVWIAAIMVGITGASYGLGMFFTQRGLMGTMDKDLELARNIADDLVSTKIDLLKSDAWTVAERLVQTESNKELVDTMEEQLKQYRNFVGFTVFDRHGIVAKYGNPTTDSTLLGESKYLDLAFEGQSVVSTTRTTTSGADPVFHVCVPMGTTRVLSVSIPGQLFSDLLSPYTLWETGNIFVIDEDGTVVASKKRESVRDRTNFIQSANVDENGREL